MVTTPSAVKYGTKAGALTWWATVAPFGKVPKSWQTQAPDRLKSSDGLYTYEAGGTKPDGSGYGNIVWNANPNDKDGGMLYVTWDASGTAPTPQTPDPGEVKPVSPFSGFTDITGFFTALSNTLFSGAWWKRLGIGAAGVVLLVIALVIILHKPIGKVAEVAALK